MMFAHWFQVLAFMYITIIDSSITIVPIVLYSTPNSSIYSSIIPSLLMHFFVPPYFI